MNTKLKALIALLGTVVFFSVLVIVAKAYVESVSPMLFLFLRMLVAAIAFAPIFLKSKVWQKKDFNKVVSVSLLSTVNVTFFMWGIQYTSASASQLIYAAQPILTILVTNYLLREKKYPLRSFIGVMVGLVGLGLIIYQSAVEHGETISGSLLGNLGITIAMLGWFWYIMLSKKISKYFSPTEIGSTSVITSFIVTFFLLLAQLFFTQTKMHLSSAAILGAIYMGFFGTFLTYILMQYAIKYLSPLTVNLSSYVQPMMVTLLAIVLLGEKLTYGFIIGGLLVFLGVFLTATLELYRRKL